MPNLSSLSACPSVQLAHAHPYSNYTTKWNIFYYSNHTYKYSVTGNEWGHLLIEPNLKPTFVNSYINKNGLFIFLNKNINTLYWINSKLHNILLYALFKTEQKATDLIKYKHKIGFDYL